MQCCYCQSELVEDFLGSYCPNEECESIDGTTRIEISTSQTKRWYKNGKLHREDGPAIEWLDDTKEWYKNGLLHREDGPAIEWSNGIKFWFKNGKRHRDDGPAIEYPSGEKEYWLNGKAIST
jgi:hypothetical protein